MPSPVMKVSKRSSSRKDGNQDMLQQGGPPREVIFKIAVRGEQNADELLDDLLYDGQSEVSSLEHTEPKHDLRKGLNETEQSKEGKVGSVTSRGVAAARERYKAQSSPRKSAQKSSSILFDEKEAEDPTRGNMEEISLGVNMTMSEKFPEVIDIEKIKTNRREEIMYANNAPVFEDNSYTSSGNMEEISLNKNVALVDKHAEVIDIEKLKNGRIDDNRYPSKIDDNRYPSKNAATDDTSKTASGTYESPPQARHGGSSKQESGKPNDSEDGSDEDTAGTKDLLNRAHDRLTIQKLHDEIEKLKNVIESKNSELEILSGQLRRAVESKCDLVLAHTDLELNHEHNLKLMEAETHNLLKEKNGLMEGQADVEKQLINEIVRLKVELQELGKKHIQELQDWERMHKNEMLERDCEIASLREEVRNLLLKQASSIGTTRRASAHVAVA